MKHLLYLLFFSCFISINLKSQNIHKFGFELDFSVPVITQTDDTLHYAWWGGLNAVQFAEMDINLDGATDLIVFDRHGNKLLPLINNNVHGQFSYTYSPQYKKYFPKDITDFIITYDFNNDAKMDIFTYLPGGIKVYKNNSTATELKFELWSYMLNSLIHTNYINIYITNVDYPIITDVDGDGDVDIIAFFILGNYAELHKNMGVELHGNPDTMDFHRDYRCWGNFMESSTSNELFLNITCPWSKNFQNNKTNPETDKQILHVGSAMLFMDTNGDGLKDLFLSDTNYPNLIRLINGGTSDSAHFVSQEFNFPSNTKSINLFSIPVSAFIDINNDDKKEFLVSAFDPSPIINETKNSIWLYKNHGTNDSLELDFIQDNFIQEFMIEHGSGAYPVLQDWNGNGLADLFVANYGLRDSSWHDSGFLYSSYTSSIALYENIGTTSSPAFKLITEDFANLSSLGKLSLYPAFADLDGDADTDMVLGNRDGNLLYFQNIAGAGNPMNMILNDTMWQNIDVGSYSTPVLFDLTKNGLPDLVVGQRMGYLSFWENTGTASTPLFVHRTDTFGQVYTADLTHSYFGHSVPAFYRNNSGKTFLFTGSARGWILQFNNIDNNLNGSFNLIDTVFVADGNDKIIVYEGMRVSPFVFDLDNNLYPELLIGNYRGGIAYYKGVHPPADTVGIKPFLPVSESFKVFPNPFTNEINIEADFKIIECKVELFSSDGRLLATQNFAETQSFRFYTPQTTSGIYLLKITYYQKDTIPKMQIVKLIRQ